MTVKQQCLKIIDNKLVELGEFMEAAKDTYNIISDLRDQINCVKEEMGEGKYKND